MSARARPRRRHGRRVQTPSTQPALATVVGVLGRIDLAVDPAGDLVAVEGDDPQGRILVRVGEQVPAQSSSVGSVSSRSSAKASRAASQTRRRAGSSRPIGRTTSPSGIGTSGMSSRVGRTIS